MTVSTAPTALSFSGDDSTADFSITWMYLAESDVVVILRGTDDSETTWVLDTDYTLTTAGVTSGGTLTATTPPATGEALVVTLEPANTQSTTFPLGGQFPSSAVETAVDRLTQITGKLAELINRSLTVPKTDTRSGSNLELPIDTDRASKFFAFDGNGDPVAASGTSADLTPVSSFINTLLDDADPGGAMATLFVKGSDVASADPLVLGTDGNYMDVTGTTGFSSITVSAGRFFVLQFDGALTLTHHSTNLNLPGGANITTVAGDRLIGFATAANQVTVVSYERGTNWLPTYVPPTEFQVAFTATTGTITVLAGSDTLVYTKIGQVVFVQGYVAIDSVSSPTGTVTMTGLPLAAINTLTENADSTGFYIPFIGVNALSIGLRGSLSAGATSVVIYEVDTTGTSGLSAADNVKAGTTLYFNFHYLTA